MRELNKENINMMKNDKYIYHIKYDINEVDKLYGLGLLERTIALCLYSGYLKERKPLSLLIIAPPSSGKSEVLLKFRRNQGVSVVNQGTRYGINKVIASRGAEVKHLIIPDLSVVLSAHPGIAGDILSLISIMTEEGIDSIQTYHFSRYFDPPLKVGLLTAVTQEDFNKRKSRLRKIGFWSRFIPFSYSYDKEVVDKVLTYVERGESLKMEESRLDLPGLHTKPVDVQCDAKYVHGFRIFIKEQEFKGWEPRFQKHIRILLKSHALANKRTEVIEEDVMEIMKIVLYLNFNFSLIGQEVGEDDE